MAAVRLSIKASQKELKLCAVTSVILSCYSFQPSSVEIWLSTILGVVFILLSSLSFACQFRVNQSEGHKYIFINIFLASFQRKHFISTLFIYFPLPGHEFHLWGRGGLYVEFHEDTVVRIFKGDIYRTIIFLVCTFTLYCVVKRLVDFLRTPSVDISKESHIA